MESDSFALRTALFLIATIALLTVTVMLFSGTRETTSPYLIFTDESISGLDQRSRVYYKGVEVGFVEEIGFAQDNYDQVRIRMEIDEQVPLATNTYAELSLRGITGEYDLTLDNEGPLGEPLATSESDPARIPLRTQYIVRLGETFEGILDEIRDLSNNLQELTNEETRAELRRLLSSTADASERFSRLQEKAESTLEELPGAVREFRQAMQQVRTSARDFGQQTEGLDELMVTVNDAVSSLDDLMAALRGQTVGDVEETMRSLRYTLRELSELADMLQRDPQSLLLGPPPATLGPGETPESRP